MKPIIQRINPIAKRVRSTFSSSKKRLVHTIEKRPFISFLGALALLFVLIVLGNILRTPPAATPEAAAAPKQVKTFRVGDSPRVVVQASVEKTGTITIVAQTPGIVQRIARSEGDRVGAAESVVWLSANYQGGNPATVGRELAARNAQFTNETYDISKDLISKQRDIAQKSNTQAEELREIGRASLDETRNLINASTSVVQSVDRQIAALQQSNVNGANDATISQLTQGKLAAQGSLAQLNAQLRVSEYNTNEDRVPAQLGDAARDLTLRQLDLQEKSLDLQRDVANLNVKLARVNEATFYPASPCAGIVERVYVSVGDSVNPGDKIATIRADQSELVATALVDHTVATKYARAEASIITFDDGTTAQIVPDYIPQDATDGTLSAIRYTIPQMYASKVANTGYVSLALPLGASAMTGADIYVPLDAIYQTQDASYIFVARKNKDGRYAVHTQEVTLAEVRGSFVRATRGVASGDTVVVSRFVQEGDTVVF